MDEGKRNWRAIFEGFRIALDVRKMALGFCALLATVVAFCVITAIFGHGAQTGVVIRGLAHFSPESNLPELGAFSHQVISLDAIKDVIMGVIFVIVAFLIWAYFGGAISRIAAVEFVKGDRIEVIEGARFAWRKKWSYLWAPLTVFLAVVAFGVCNFLGGLLAGAFYYILGIVVGLALSGYIFVLLKDKLFGGKKQPGLFILSIFGLAIFVVIYYLFGRAFPRNFYIPWVGEIVAALLSVFAFVAAFFITMLAIGGGFGFGMMWPTISAEGTDSFDAISRAFSYVFSKPWRFIFYNVVNCLYGAVCLAFVAGVALLTSWLGVKIPALALGDRVDQLLGALNWELRLGEAGGLVLLVIFLRIWLAFLRLAVLSYAASFAITSATIIYFLMRKAVDGTEMSEVYIEEMPEEEELPAEAEEQPETEEKPAAEPAEEESSEPVSDEEESDTD